MTTEKAMITRPRAREVHDLLREGKRPISPNEGGAGVFKANRGPDILPFVATPTSQQGACLFKVYIDETNVHDGALNVAVAAYMARPSKWQKWTRRWNAKKRPIDVYHATDAANLQGEFSEWTKENVASLFAKLAAVICEFEMPGMVIGIDLVAYRNAMSEHPNLAPLFGTPYTACFQYLVQNILILAHTAGNRDRIDFVHEDNNYVGEATEAFEWIKEHANPGSNPISLKFGGKHEFPPLQCADVLAYEGAKRLRNLDGTPRKAWTALDPDLTRIAGFYYSSERMPYLVDRLLKIRDGQLTTQEQLEATPELKAVLWKFGRHQKRVGKGF